MKIQVYLNDSPSTHPQLVRLHKVLQFDVAEFTPIRVQLEEVFAQLNIGGEFINPTAWTMDYRAAGHRSLSVGDVVVVGETAWQCAVAGWVIVSTDYLLGGISRYQHESITA